MKRTAILSPDRVYRYTLWRQWDERPYCMFIGLNPSTADETNDDPTIRRCIRFAQDWNFGALCMTNLFAFRATQPDDMMRAPDPVGAENDEHLKDVALLSGRIIAAWGVGGAHLSRGNAVRGMFSSGIHHLGLTKAAQPKHPLYLRADTLPKLWTT